MNTTDPHTDPKPRHTRGIPRNPNTRNPLLWLEMSFSTAGYGALRAYRQKLAMERGGTIPLGVALDDLIRSHPFCADKGREE